jgi:hypothetical protein
MDKNTKSKLVDLLIFPKQLLLKEINARNCIHNAEFCMCDIKCWDCDLGRECFELIGKQGGFGLKSSQEVCLKRIGIAQKYIHNKLKNWQHDRMTCDCDACNWLRNTTRILFAIDS